MLTFFFFGVLSQVLLLGHQIIYMWFVDINQNQFLNQDISQTSPFICHIFLVEKVKIQIPIPQH